MFDVPIFEHFVKFEPNVRQFELKVFIEAKLLLKRQLHFKILFSDVSFCMA